MLSRFGIEASQAAQYVIAFVIILVLVALFGVVLRRLTGGRLMLPGQDRGRARQPRLGIVDIYDLDRQRQLILLRRDNVEHLLLIGGPNDVVIETNIVRVPGARLPASATDTVVERTEPAFERPAEPARPQIEPSNGRPSIEAQLAARLGALASRPAESVPPGASDADEELAPVMTASASASVRPEPALKPDAVTLAPQAPMPVPPRPAPSMPAPPVSAPPAPPLRPGPVEPPPFLRPEPRVEPRPEPRPNPVAAPPVQPPRPAPIPAPAPVASPAPVPTSPPTSAADSQRSADPVFQPPRPAPAAPPAPPVPAESRAPDAALLSDMAKQLEEALRRPNAGPARPAPAPTPPAPPATGAPAMTPAAPPSGVLPLPPVPPGAVVSPAPTPVSDPQRDEEEDEADDLLEPSEESRPISGPTPPPAARMPEPPRPSPEPVRPAAEAPRPTPEPPRFVPPAPSPMPNGPAAPAAPAPARSPEPPTPPAPAAAPASPRVVDDPFSVEEIEAEFARLLGRPGGDKS